MDGQTVGVFPFRSGRVLLIKHQALNESWAMLVCIGPTITHCIVLSCSLQ